MNERYQIPNACLLQLCGVGFIAAEKLVGRATSVSRLRQAGGAVRVNALPDRLSNSIPVWSTEHIGIRGGCFTHPERLQRLESGWNSAALLPLFL